jgi:threonine/homoserine/homoserine lactone efflux protein
LTVSTVDAAAAAKEMRRWVAWLGGAMLGACFFTALALAGLGAWLLAPAIVIGPGVGGIALVWLALSSDTNGAVAAPAAVDEPVLAKAAA